MKSDDELSFMSEQYGGWYSEEEVNVQRVERGIMSVVPNMPASAQMGGPSPFKPPLTPYKCQLVTPVYLLKHHMIRHTKHSRSVNEDLALPPRTLIVHNYTLSDLEAKLYSELERRVKDRVKSLMHRVVW
mgnify:CR=1 FL=1